MNIFKKIYYIMFNKEDFVKCIHDDCDNYISSFAALYFGQDICFKCQKIDYRIKCYDKLWKDYKKIVLPIIINKMYNNRANADFGKHINLQVDEIVKKLLEAHDNEISDIQYKTINKLIDDEFGIESKNE